MVSLSALSASNNLRWQKAVMDGGRKSTFTMVARRLTAAGAKQQYQEIEADTKVPWFIVAVIHERESTQNWTRGIAQGDPWNKKSVHVPAGRGPFASFRAAAYDALVNCAPKAAQWTDWSIGGCLALLEQYNGLGYANGPRARDSAGNVVQYPPMPSPYIWGGTNIQTRGKYVADGKFDPNTVDSQLGCAGLLMAMQELDPTIVFGRPVPVNTAPVARTSPAKGAIPVIPPAHAPSIVPPQPAVPVLNPLGEFFKSLFSVWK